MFKMMQGVAVVALFAASACGASVPAARMASAQAAIRAADEVGAARHPTAALHLQYAREQYTQAETLSRNGDGERAQMVLARAEADAELAVALARTSGSRTEAREAVEQVRSMQKSPRSAQ